MFKSSGRKMLGSSVNNVSRPGDLELQSGSHLVYNFLSRTSSLFS